MFIPSVTELALLAEISWGSWVVVGVFILFGLGVIYGLKTRKGSGINEHPGPDSGDPVITEQSDPARTAGDDGLGEEDDRDSMLDQRGTK